MTNAPPSNMTSRRFGVLYNVVAIALSAIRATAAAAAPGDQRPVSEAGVLVWIATEYIPARSRQTTDGRRNWGTRAFQVSLAS